MDPDGHRMMRKIMEQVAYVVSSEHYSLFPPSRSLFSSFAMIPMVHNMCTNFLGKKIYICCGKPTHS